MADFFDGQGYGASLTIDGTEWNFKRLIVDERAGMIDTTSRFLPSSDGPGTGAVNSGFATEDGDTTLLVVRFEGLADDTDADNLENFLTYYGGSSYPDVEWEVGYGSRSMYTGTGISVRSPGMNASIPGDATVVFEFSAFAGYTKVGAI